MMSCDNTLMTFHLYFEIVQDTQLDFKISSYQIFNSFIERLESEQIEKSLIINATVWMALKLFPQDSTSLSARELICW